ncbi:MAG: helix-turn-helix domain-containing protein [Armatimonadetes bacterium]|nr:helix-turn-helix domain-containing protein [Armatimonadota bacterium]
MKYISNFPQIAKRYQKEFDLPLLFVDPQGNVVQGEACCANPEDSLRCREARQRAVEETLRWGEPYLHLCLGNCVIWAVPVMHNAELTGGIVSGGVPIDDCSPEKWGAARIRAAANRLMELAVEGNLTNAALLQLRRIDAKRESERAEAIHELKSRCYDSIRDIYLREEPELLAAIKRGDRPQAREILNRVLVGIYFLGRDRPSLLKSFLLELVVMMSRTAVECGAEPSQLLGANFSNLVDLASVSDEADLSSWLVSMLERIMDSIKEQRAYPNTVLLTAALQFMEARLADDISRDDAAAAACMSPSHFSRLVKDKFGRSFTEILTQMRIDRSKELLRLTDKSILQVCLDCGFNDQSYFTKVFQRYIGSTPREYRLRVRTSFK